MKTFFEWAFIVPLLFSVYLYIKYTKENRFWKKSSNFWMENSMKWQDDSNDKQRMISNQDDLLASYQEANKAKSEEIVRINKKLKSAESMYEAACGVVVINNRKIKTLEEVIRLKDEFIQKRNVQFHQAEHAVEIMANLLDGKTQK